MMQGPEVEIIPITCFAGTGCLPWILHTGAPLATLVIGALLMPRWRDLPLVAFVTLLVVLGCAVIYQYGLRQDLAAWHLETKHKITLWPDFAEPLFWLENLARFGVFLLASAIPFCIKRLVSRLLRPPLT